MVIPTGVESFLDASLRSLGTIGEAVHAAIAEATVHLTQCFFLDCGCGEGGLTAAVLRARQGSGPTFATGVDRNQTLLDRYQERFPSCVVVLKDLESPAPFGFTGGAFDCAVAAFLLEHLTSDAQLRLVREAARVAPRFIFGVHRFEGLDYASYPKVEEEPGRFRFSTPAGPMRLGTPSYYASLCERAGFATVRKHKAIPFPETNLLDAVKGKEAATVYVAER